MVSGKEEQAKHPGDTHEEGERNDGPQSFAFLLVATLLQLAVLSQAENTQDGQKYGAVHEQNERERRTEGAEECWRAAYPATVGRARETFTIRNTYRKNRLLKLQGDKDKAITAWHSCFGPAEVREMDLEAKTENKKKKK